MRALPLLLVALLMAACSSSPTTPRKITFTGEYIDARKDSSAKISPVHREPLRPLGYLDARGFAESAVIAFMVEADGKTSEVQIVSTTDQQFAEAVCESVSGWRYAPPVKDGKPVRVVLEESFGFRPQNRYPRTP